MEGIAVGGKLVSSLKQLIFTGVDESKDFHSIRSTVLVNILSVVLIMFTMFMLVLYLPFVPLLSLILLIYAVLLFGGLLLNYYKFYLAAKLYFSFISVLFLIIGSVVSGKESNWYLFVVTSFFLSFFIFNESEKKISYSLFILLSLTFIGVEISFYYYNLSIIPQSVILPVRAIIDLGLIIFVFFISFYTSYVIQQAEKSLEEERRKSDQLLLNILPEAIAKKLKAKPGLIAERFDDATILFADIVGFTKLSNSLTATAIVNILNQVFSEFDKLTERYGVEKIKTIGDAYMVAGGIPEWDENHLEKTVNLALVMQQIIKEKFYQQYKIDFRIGIHCGPIVAGVIGQKKFIYDLWGDSVNIASRMESHGVTGEIQVSSIVYERLKDRYLFEPQGKKIIKGKAEMNTYLLRGPILLDS